MKMITSIKEIREKEKKKEREDEKRHEHLEELPEAVIQPSSETLNRFRISENEINQQKNMTEMKDVIKPKKVDFIEQI